MRRLIVAVILAVVVSGAVRVFADDGDFLLAKPKQCETATWDSWEYYFYGCYAF
jgi:hypothetical protein